MKTTTNTQRLLTGILLAVITLSMTSSAAMTAPYKDSIQTSSLAEESRLSVPREQGGDENIEQFRKKLLAHYDDLLKLYPYIEKAAPPDLVDKINDSKDNIKSLSKEELMDIKEVFDENPVIFTAPVQIREVFEQEDSLQRTPERAPGVCPAALPEDWCGCPSGAPGGLEAVYIAKGVAQGLEFALAFVPSDEVVVAAGFGGTIWAHPAKIFLQASYETAKASALVLEGYYAVNDACHQSYHRALLDQHDTEVQYKLDNLMELRRVHLQVIELKEKREFLVSATEAGVPIEGIEFISIKYATNNKPEVFTDITDKASITMVEKGIYLVKLNGQYKAGAPSIYAFEVKHTADIEEHFGFTLFDRIGTSKSQGGQ